MGDLTKTFEFRFGEAPADPPEAARDAARLDLSPLERMAARRSHRRFRAEPVSLELLQTLAAVALAAPTKSDLQQRDIVIVKDPVQKARLTALVAAQDWIAGAPELIVVCANNRRQRLLHEWRGRPFPNDHLDAFFNAAVDAGIALQAFVGAAEAIGLGCCPISTIRNRIDEASTILALPDHTFPIAALAVGWPEGEGRISMRLPLDVTVHVDRYREQDLAGKVAAYDRRRAAAQPYRSQRATDRFGTSADYGWSEEKARQYSVPERADFGSFVRKRKFNLD